MISMTASESAIALERALTSARISAGTSLQCKSIVESPVGSAPCESEVVDGLPVKLAARMHSFPLTSTQWNPREASSYEQIEGVTCCDGSIFPNLERDE